MNEGVRKEIGVLRILFTIILSLVVLFCTACGGGDISGGDSSRGSADTDKVTGLKVTDVYRNKVAIAWDCCIGAAGYTVYRDGDPVATTTEPYYLDSGLTQGKPYKYKVAVINDKSTESTEIEGTPLPWTKKMPGQINVIKQFGNYVYIGGTNTFYPDGRDWNWFADAYLAKYDLNGNLVWETTFKHLTDNAKYTDWVSDIAISPSGDNLYVTGTVDYLSDEKAESGDYAGGYKFLKGNSFVAKFDISGDRPRQKWLNIVSDIPNNLSFGEKIAVDSSENAYVLSKIEFDVGYISNPNWTCSVTSYDKDGNSRWVYRWNLVETMNTGVHFHPHLLDVDRKGNLYVSGQLQGVKIYYGYYATYDLQEKKPHGDGGYSIYYIPSFLRARLNLNTGIPEWEVVQKSGWNPANPTVLDHLTGNMYHCMLDIDVWGDWPNRGLMKTGPDGDIAWLVGGVGEKGERDTGKFDYWAVQYDNNSLYLGGTNYDSNYGWDIHLAKYDVSGTSPQLVYRNTFVPIDPKKNSDEDFLWTMGIVKGGGNTSIWTAVRTTTEIDGLPKKEGDYYAWYLMRFDANAQSWW